MLSQKAEEILEELWVTAEENHPDVSERADEESYASTEPAMLELEDLGLVSREAGRLSLSERGVKEAESVVRRHRLAERLMTDVLDIRGLLLEENACRFEHLLREEVEESVCTLLGHPRECPHGKPIPIGPCCKRVSSEVRSFVLPLSELAAGEKGRVAYLRTEHSRRLQKLLTLGILPGVEIKLLRRFPSFVLRMGHCELAIDREMAEGIQVRLGKR
jgi:DtxR family Mn-dependent transcriptional regulator